MSTLLTNTKNLVTIGAQYFNYIFLYPQIGYCCYH